MKRNFSSFQYSKKAYLLSQIRFPKQSGQQDLNLRPLGPQPSALPSYAIPRSLELL